MIDDVAVADDRAEISVIEELDLVDFVTGAEAVEEVEEWNTGTQRRGVTHEREVVRLLHGAGGEHRPAGRARVHHV